MNKTKPWTCAKCKTECPDRWGFCGGCGSVRPAPEAAPSEDERLAEKLDHAFFDAWEPINRISEEDRHDSKMVLNCASVSAVACAENFLAKARSLLEPAAYARGKQDGRRAAINEMRRAFAASTTWTALGEWIDKQRDACGPAKVVPSLADQARVIIENPGEPTRELVDLFEDRGQAKAERPSDEFHEDLCNELSALVPLVSRGR